MTATPTDTTSPVGFDINKTIAIAGLGLLGASLALALKKFNSNIRIVGYARRQETVNEALSAGIIDAGSVNPEEVLPKADLTVICMPIEATIDFAINHKSCWHPGAVVTDVGSIKADIVEAIQPALAESGVHFIGSHPMAGSENSGLSYADADLYRGAVVFLTPDERNDTRALAMVSDLWKTAGARLHELPAATHDALVARTSHVIHLLSGAAVNTILNHENAHLGTASGFRDFSRIAAGSATMWKDIISHNREQVLQALDEIDTELKAVRKQLLDKNWDDLLEHLQGAAAKRRSWYQKWQNDRGKTS